MSYGYDQHIQILRLHSEASQQAHSQGLAGLYGGGLSGIGNFQPSMPKEAIALVNIKERTFRELLQKETDEWLSD